MPLYRAQVLTNILLTHERQRNIPAAIEICREILRLQGLTQTTAGVVLHGQITGRLRDLHGKSIWTSPSTIVLLAAYTAGASVGAGLGSKVQGAGFTVFGNLINQDLRYGAACLGALLLLFLFGPILTAVGPVISALVGVACTGLTIYMLLEKELIPGLVTIGILVLIPPFVVSVLPAMIGRNR